MTALPRNTILVGDALDHLKRLPDDSVDSCITSPPYYMLRDYFVEHQIGLEHSVDEWVDKLVDVFTEGARVLKATGSLWLNLGDSFSRHPRFGAPSKGLLCAPERLLLALAGSGYIVRNKVVWAKTNPMPSSVGDRLTLTYEHIYFLVRSQKYFFDLDAIREPHRSVGARRAKGPIKQAPAWAGPLAGSQDGLRLARPDGIPGHLRGKNPGDVWSFGTRGFRGPHFATFPEELVVRPLLSTCPEVICVKCHRPWRRDVSVKRIGRVEPTAKDRFVMKTRSNWQTIRSVGDLIPCGCKAPTRPGVVLDPFFGAGTVGLVGEKHGRDWVGIELSPEFAELADRRIEDARAKNETEPRLSPEKRAA